MIFLVSNVYAKKSYSIGIKVNTPKVSFKSSKQSYTKKRAYEGMSKKSNNNGQMKTKGISGHGKRTCKGYTYVQPYARSK